MPASTGARRSRVVPLLNGIEVIIPARSGIGLLYVGIILFIWGDFAVQLLTQRGRGGSPPPVLFLFPAVLGTAWLLFLFISIVFGRQRIVATRDELVLIGEVGPLRRTQRFEASQIRALRVVDAPTGLYAMQRRWSPPLWRAGAGPLAFDYGFRTIRCASGVTEAEARVIADEVSAHLRLTAEPARVV